jgi:hypothetical protein
MEGLQFLPHALEREMQQHLEQQHMEHLEEFLSAHNIRQSDLDELAGADLSRPVRWDDLHSEIVVVQVLAESGLAPSLSAATKSAFADYIGVLVGDLVYGPESIAHFLEYVRHVLVTDGCQG